MSDLQLTVELIDSTTGRSVSAEQPFRFKAVDHRYESDEFVCCVTTTPVHSADLQARVRVYTDGVLMQTSAGTIAVDSDAYLPKDHPINFFSGHLQVSWGSGYEPAGELG